MGFAPLALTAVSTGLGAYGQYKSGQQANEAAKYNADIQRSQADEQRKTMIENRHRMNRNKRTSLSTVDLQQANSGILSDTGTPVIQRAGIESRLDERISDFTEQAMAREQYTRSQASMTEFTGQQQAAASKTAAFGTILGGIGKMGGQYASGTKSGSIPDTFGIWDVKK